MATTSAKSTTKRGTTRSTGGRSAAARSTKAQSTKARSTKARSTSGHNATASTRTRTGARQAPLAERAVLVPVGAGLLASDNLVSTVQGLASRYGTRASMQRELARYERRGTAARNRVERQFRHTRTRVERELRRRRVSFQRLLADTAGRMPSIS